MRTVDVADLKNNFRARLERVRTGEELVIKVRNRPVARLVPIPAGVDLNAEEEALVAAGLLRPPTKEMSDNFLTLPAPRVAMRDIQAVIRAERDED